MVTVIMTIWKRDNVQEQINALLSQTVLPDKIWIYHCGDHLELDADQLSLFPIIEYQHNTGDLGYFGRFSLGLLAKTKYVYILDDDVIPTKNWIENCILLCDKYNSIITSTGRIIPRDNFTPEVIENDEYMTNYIIGDSNWHYNTNFCDQDTFVDFGCSSWFFQRDWLYMFWSSPPYTYLTGEDIHLSAACFTAAGIRTLVPFQDGELICGSMKKQYGWDEYASWRTSDFFDKRTDIFKHWINENKWVPINW